MVRPQRMEGAQMSASERPISANYTEDFASARETRGLPLLGVGRG